MTLMEAVAQRCSVKKMSLKNLQKFTGKYLCWGLFFNKVAVLRSAILSKNRLQHKCFPVNFEELLGTPSFQKSSGRLLLID